MFAAENATWAQCSIFFNPETCQWLTTTPVVKEMLLQTPQKVMRTINTRQCYGARTI